MVEALIWIQEVVGSNPILPTNVRMLELVDKIVLETIGFQAMQVQALLRTPNGNIYL